MRFQRLIGSAIFAATLAASGAAFAFETTSIGGANADGTANLLEPTDQDLNKALGGLQFGVTAKTDASAESGDDGRPPWELKPTPPMRSFYSSSPMGGASMYRSDR